MIKTVYFTPERLLKQLRLKQVQIANNLLELDGTYFRLENIEQNPDGSTSLTLIPQGKAFNIKIDKDGNIL